MIEPPLSRIIGRHNGCTLGDHEQRAPKLAASP